jgi:hypothetical protein
VRAASPCGSLEIYSSGHNETVACLRFGSRWGLPPHGSILTEMALLAPAFSDTCATACCHCAQRSPRLMPHEAGQPAMIVRDMSPSCTRTDFFRPCGGSSPYPSSSLLFGTRLAGAVERNARAAILSATTWPLSHVTGSLWYSISACAHSC